MDTLPPAGGAASLAAGSLLGPAEIRMLAAASAVRPTKRLGQNFLHDANTIRRIVRIAGVAEGDAVLEVGPGLGSLTFGLLEAGAEVTAVEIDPVLAASVAASAVTRGVGARLTVIPADALTVTAADLATSAGRSPELLVANLPYNVSVPVLLHLLETVPTLRSALVLVQAEVGERLAAAAGSRIYGVPSVKAAWFAEVTMAGMVPRSVFWPAPNVDSMLVRLARRPVPALPAGVTRQDVFTVVDAAFAQRRKMLRSALAQRAGSSAAASEALLQAGIDPTARGETLDVGDFVRVAAALMTAPAGSRVQ